MKKLLKLFPLILSSSLVLAGCNDFEPNWPMSEPTEEDMAIDTPWVDYAVTCSSITFGKGENALNLNKGDTHQFTYTVEPRNASLSSLVWESDDTSVATVQNGLLTAVGGGSANITVSSGDAVARSRVKVTVPITDFEISNKSLDLDLGEKAQLLAVFTPSDTTQNGLTYSLESDEFVSVSETGLVTAKKAGNAQIRVTNEVMDKIETVNVTVSDKWNYVQSLSLSGPANVEITKSGTIACDVVAADTTKDASTLAYHNVKFAEKKANESDPALLEVNEATGEFTALGLGDATIVAKLYDDRKGEDVSAEIGVHIFEVNATAISISPTDPIELDNATHLSAQLSYALTLDTGGYEAPSRGRVTFSTSDNNVAKVSDDGLVEPVGPGNAVIKAKYINPNYELESSGVNVHVTAYASSVTITSNSSAFYLDEVTEITANVTPANTSSAIVWHYTDGTGHTFVENGNKLSITCNNLEHAVIVYASATGSEGAVNSNQITLNPVERQVNFENGKTYIVGSANYKTGVAKDSGVDGSWAEAKYAFVMSDRTGNAYALYEYKATITFRQNDLWKIRENESDWREIEGYVGENESRHKIGYYKVTEGAFASGQMGVTAGGEVKVNEAGKYDIYYAYYKNDTTPAEGWYEVYVEEHGMKLSSTSVHAKYTSPVPTLSTITASNWEGTLRVDEVETSIITVEVGTLTGSIVITPVAVGETAFKVLDDAKEFTVNVSVVAGSSAATTGLYIRGTAAGGWSEVSAEFALRESENDAYEGEILDVYLQEGEFKIANNNWSTEYGWEKDGHSIVTGPAAAKFGPGSSDNNIKCNVAGYYNIHLTTGHLISIDTVGGDEESNLSLWYVRGSAVGTWDAIPANQMTVGEGDNQAVILGLSMSVGEFKIAQAIWDNGQYGWDYDGHPTIIGGAAANFAAGTSDNNIKCNVAGVYNLYLMTNHYISVELATPPTPVFALSATSGRIVSGGSFVVTASNVTGTLAYDVTSGTAAVVIDGSNATISSSTVGTATIAFSDDSEASPIVFTLTVLDPSATYRQYIETKAWFNSGSLDEHVYVYAFENGSDPVIQNAAFPGEEATYVKDLDEGKKLFYFDIGVIYDTFIISKVEVSTKTYQTDNITISTLSGDNCVWIGEQPVNTDTYIEVGHYNYVLGLSANSGTIASGGSTTVTLQNYIGDVDYAVSPLGSATVSIVGNVATISSSTEGTSTITFSDDAGCEAVYTLTVNPAASVRRVYIETKTWFNSGSPDEHVYVYAFVAGTNPAVEKAAFPGEEATYVTDKEGGKKIFYFDIPAEYDSFIVSKVVSGSKVYQTVDIALTSLGEHNCVYLNADGGSDSIPVGYYTYTPE